MGQGSRGHIGIKKETTWGEKVAGANDCFLPFLSETLTENIEELLSAAQRGILDEPKSYQGEKSFGGDLVIEVNPQTSFGHILRSALNKAATAEAAGTTQTELEDCEDKWDELVDGGVISGVDAVDYKKGTKSVKLQVTADVAADDILATEVLGSIDMTSDTHVKLWIKSSVACENADDLKLRLSNVAECDGEEGVTMKTVNIGTLVANTWTEVTLSITNDYLNDVDSIGIIMHGDIGECTIHIDDVRRVVTGEAATAKQHIFTPRQATDFHADCPINPYTLEVYRDQGNAFQFLGAIVNTMALNFSTTDKILKATLGIIAKNLGDVEKTGLSLETQKPFVWEDATITISAAGTVPAVGAMNDIESFSLTWDNKCVAKYFLNNTAIPGKIIRTGFREIPVSFVIDFVSRTEYDNFLAGTERSFTIKFVGKKIDTGPPASYYTLQIDLPSVRYLTYPINMPGSSRLICAVTAKAKYDAAGYSLLATLINLEDTGEYDD